MSTVPAAVPAPERPLPSPTRESQPHWDGMREGRFLLQHCAACGKVRHYPRPVCPHCAKRLLNFMASTSARLSTRPG